jgi:hypothetical protein
MKKIVIMVVILSVLLLGAIGYIGFNFYSNAKYSQQVGIYNQGMSAGASNTIKQITDLAVTCEVVPIPVSENQSIEMIAVACLQQPAA